MKRTLITLLGIAIGVILLAAPAQGAIGPNSSPYVTDPIITSAIYDSSTQVLSLAWTMGDATNGGYNLQLVGQNLRTSTSPSTTGGTLTYPTSLWVSDAQTRLNTSLSKDFSSPLTPGTYYLQLENVGVIDSCSFGPCPPNPPSVSTFNNNSPVASFTAAAPPPRPPPPPPPPPPPAPAVRCVVPTVVGRSLATAKRKLIASHCRTGRVGYGHSRSRRGLVYSQSRKPGARLARGTRISVLISLGRR